MVRVSEQRSLAQRKADVLAALSLTTSSASRTARNLVAVGTARLALGSPQDVIVVDAVLVGRAPVARGRARLGDGFAAAVGWDPRTIDPGWGFYHLRPSRLGPRRRAVLARPVNWARSPVATAPFR